MCVPIFSMGRGSREVFILGTRQGRQGRYEERKAREVGLAPRPDTCYITPRPANCQKDGSDKLPKKLIAWLLLVLSTTSYWLGNASLIVAWEHVGGGALLREF